MASHPRRPDRYRLRIATPAWTAHVLVEHGWCTQADGKLIDLVGKSAAWIYGHVRFEGWTATMLPASEQGSLL
jgi:hypothetical protein